MVKSVVRSVSRFHSDLWHLNVPNGQRLEGLGMMIDESKDCMALLGLAWQTLTEAEGIGFVDFPDISRCIFLVSLAPSALP